MKRNWLSGTAVAAVLVATPALAQDDTICTVNDIDDSRIMNERINQLDVDNDGRITLVEYEECLERVGVAEEDREQFRGEFERMDQNDDDILVLAELEAEMQAAGVAEEDMQIAFDTEGEAAEVAVQQPTPEVEVEQAEPEVIIENVTDVEAEEQRAAAPEAGMVRELPEAEGAAEAEATQEETDVAAADTAATATDAEATPAIPFADLEGEEAFNQAGAELGEITDVVMEVETGDLYVVVSAGGFLDIGDTDIVFPYEDVAMIDDQVVIETSLTEETIEEREDFDETRFTDVPADRMIR